MRLALAVLLATALLGASCTGDDEPAADTGGADAGALRIFAPSSVEGVFRELAPDADFRFGSSEQLAAAAVDGEVPDIFASAGEPAIGEVGAEGVLEPPIVFATNRLVLVVPAGNPKGIESLDDLDGVGLMYGAEQEYVRGTLEAIDKGEVLTGVDYLPDAAEAVAAGTLDSALVYATDAQAAGADVEVIDLPVQALVEYSLAISNLGERFDEAEAFVTLLLGDEGRALLEAAGFGLPPETGS